MSTALEADTKTCLTKPRLNNASHKRPNALQNDFTAERDLDAKCNRLPFACTLIAYALARFSDRVRYRLLFAIVLPEKFIAGMLAFIVQRSLGIKRIGGYPANVISRSQYL